MRKLFLSSLGLGLVVTLVSSSLWSQTQASDAMQLFEEGKRLYAAKSYRLAQKTFQEALKEDQKLTVAQNYLDLCQQQLQWENKKEEMLLHIAQHEEDLHRREQVRVWLNQGIQCYEDDRLDAARVEFEKVMKFDATNHVAQKYLKHIQEVQLQMEQNKLQIMKERQRIMETLNKDRMAQRFFEDGVAFLKERRYQIALDQFQKTLEISPGFVWAKEYIDLCQESLKWDSRQRQIEFQLNQMYLQKIEEVQQLAHIESRKLFDRGKDLFLDRSYDEALEIFQKALEIDPQNIFATDYASLCQKVIDHRDRNEQQQLKLIQTTVEKDMAFQDALQHYEDKEMKMTQGRKLFDENKYEMAQQLFKNLLQEFPNDLIVKDYFDLCKMAQVVKQDQLRGNAFVQKVLVRQERIEENFNKGRQYYAAGQFPLSIQFFQKVLKDNPKHALAQQYIALSRNAYTLQQQQKQLELRDEQELLAESGEIEIKRIHNNKINVLLQEGIDAFDQKKYQLASERFKQILAIQAQHQVARDYLQMCENYLAVDHIRVETKLERHRKKLMQESLSFFKQGQKAIDAKEYEKAVKLFQKSWKLFPEGNHIAHLQELIELCFKEINRQRKLRQDSERQRHLMDARVLMQQGLDLMSQDQYEKSIQAFQKAFKASSDKVLHKELEHYIEQSYQFLRQLQIREKEQQLEHAYQQALDLYQQKKWYQALQLLRQVEAYNPLYKDVELYIRLIVKKHAVALTPQI